MTDPTVRPIHESRPARYALRIRGSSRSAWAMRTHSPVVDHDSRYLAASQAVSDFDPWSRQRSSSSILPQPVVGPSVVRSRSTRTGSTR